MSVFFAFQNILNIFNFFTQIFLEDEGFAPPPSHVDMSAKNVSFFERFP